MKRPTYANVAATLALVVTFGGTAYAAGLPRNSVGTAQLKKNAVTSAKIKKAAVTPSDLSKATKKLARSGPVSAGVITGQVTPVDTANPGIGYFRRATLGGISGMVLFSENIATLTPARPSRVRDLSVSLKSDVPAGGSVLVELVAASGGNDTGQPAAIGCTVAGTAATDDLTCTSAGSAPVPASSFVWIRATVTGGTSESTSPTRIFYGLTLEPA